MPTHHFHKKISKALFGTTGEEIHKSIDSGYKMWGAEHRKHTPHDLFTAAALGFVKDKENPMRGATIGATHIITDELFSTTKRKNKRKDGR